MTAKDPRASCCVVLGLLITLPLACSSDDDGQLGGDAGPDAEAACSEYAHELSDIARGLPGKYRGSITDAAQEVPCRYDGQPFELELEVDSDSVCSSDAACLRPPFSCGLSGTLAIDGTLAGQVDGAVAVSQGSVVAIFVSLASSPIGDGGIDAKRFVMLDGVDHTRDLGSPGALAEVRWSHAAGPDGGGVEACLLEVDEVL
jgi:hypothetical protein